MPASTKDRNVRKLARMKKRAKMSLATTTKPELTKCELCRNFYSEVPLPSIVYVSTLFTYAAVRRELAKARLGKKKRLSEVCQIEFLLAQLAFQIYKNLIYLLFNWNCILRSEAKLSNEQVKGYIPFCLQRNKLLDMCLCAT